MTTTAPPQAGATPKRRRGFETSLDMVRSLGLVLLVVVPMWFLAQPGEDAEQEIRPVDQAPQVQAWSAAAPGAPVPARPLPGWTPTVSDLREGTLRLGWNTAAGHYAEVASTTGPATPFVEDLAGGVAADGTVEVAGGRWARHTEDDGSISLVRRSGPVTVVVGTRRTNASLEELVELAGTLAPAG